ncbi:hypothetical protein [uncultured Rikenella sp.]|uniref:hypothetical protein n=1 Tax=uncultured Rikenella sp. TaxID=368003 RepID=UPI00262A24C0|nr:hypothetical protein [uncultured Rikenella sp.]
MKARKISLVIFGVFFLGVGVFAAIHASKTAPQYSDLVLANIEALGILDIDKDPNVLHCCAPWDNFCGTMETSPGVYVDVPGTPCGN